MYDGALHLYKEQLHPCPLSLTASILPSIIKASAYAQNKHVGLQLHCIVLKSGADAKPVLSNSLISMYAKFSDVECARKLFDDMPVRDEITWNSMVNGFIRNGYFVESLEMFKEMYARDFVAKPELIASVVSTCVKTGDFGLGREIHGLVVVNGLMEEESVFLSTALVDLNLRCQCHDSLMAFRVFERVGERNEVSWTAMISGCVANQNYGIALDCFRAMQGEGIKPNRLGCLGHGKEIHGYAFRHGFDSDVCISSALMHMYCNCGESLCSIKLIFDRSITKDVVMWSSMISCFAQSEDSAEEAMKQFHERQIEGFQPNYVTLLTVVSACTSLRSLSHGRGVHRRIMKSGLVFELFIGNSLLNMYAKCGCLTDSSNVLEEMSVRDNFSWSTIIGAYGLHGYGEEALQLFHEMQERGEEPDSITFLAVLSACNHCGLLEEGKKLFNKAVRDQKTPPSIEHYACHIDLLGRAGKVKDACDVVSTMPMNPSMKIWSSLVSACKLHGRLEIAEALAHWLVKLEPENTANHTMLSLVYAESGNWLGVEQLRKYMTVKGLRKRAMGTAELS
ncbi:hypothetical protein RHSIM_RhsimUnG0082000 [Rhododendron simsii]|uniref:Pentatricopeptide repeat-containing protein n=1 Tax=Rhododendron simsii TaxID=118357 RepID=A0A834FWU5_RHOSS|nr:hypothetical protein RHSIM_RhsimUnG0082000 [Rhododendron simsii]